MKNCKEIEKIKNQEKQDKRFAGNSGQEQDNEIAKRQDPCLRVNNETHWCEQGKAFRANHYSNRIEFLL